jgi:hypothetical protein
MPIPEVDLNVSSLVLVTTAELWTFRDDIDLDQIEAADSVEQIAERVKAVEFSAVLSHELRAHQSEWIAAIEKTFGVRSNAPEREIARKELWPQVSRAVQEANPSVLVVEYRSLKDVLNAQAAAIQGKVLDITHDFARAGGHTVR